MGLWQAVAEMKHLLGLEHLAAWDMRAILDLVPGIKTHRYDHVRPLAGKTWALIFSKSSTRTRVSFEVGIRELGGNAIFLNANDIQLGRGEPIKDTARVLGRMVHGAVIRTYAQHDVEEFAQYSKIPTINALTDDEHPCQILTDIFTFEELTRERINGKVVTFVGDGACNVPVSWLWAAARLGFELRIAAPRKYWPANEIIARAAASTGNVDLPGDSGANKRIVMDNGVLELTEDLHWAVRKADLVYTDVWISMGKEAESEVRIKELSGYQINDEMLQHANPSALVMHCLPAYRGKEITEHALETHADTIFSQAENRLHTQKAIISWLIRSSNLAA